MKAKYEELYSELRNSKEELVKSLSNKGISTEVELLIKEELQDINTCLTKINSGEYGKCEISGEFIPIEILELIPTIKTMNDLKNIGYFYRKSF